MRKIEPKTVAEHPMAAKLLSGVLMRHASQQNDTAVMKEAQELSDLADQAQSNLQAQASAATPVDNPMRSPNR